MLDFQHMNLKPFLLIAGLLLAALISSCAPMGPMDGEVSQVVTAGNRSGDFAVADNTVDSILNNPKRPGLATGWGDSKNSNVHFVSFERNSSKPVGTDRIYYNDKQGFDAMTRSPRKVQAMQRAAGSLVEWGIKSGWSYMPSYKDYGDGRRFVVGKKGSNYSIAIKNLSGNPVEVVCSVDGLDVQDGKSAAYSKRGYIIDPGRTLEIDGFRTSHNRVAAFEFSSVANSYANLKHGDARNVGVIGLAVFTPKGMRNWATAPDQGMRAAASPFSEEP